MRYKYTDEDIHFLKINYPLGKWDLIHQRFPHLTDCAIHHKCHKLGIKFDLRNRSHIENSNKRQWDESELEIIKRYYSCKPIDELMTLLPKRTKNAIIGKANTMKLLSYHKISSSWKPHEIDYIKDNWLLEPDSIMAKKIRKTFRAVKAKREELGLYRRDSEGSSYPTLSKYLRGQNQKWKNDSMKECDYKCVLTGSKSFEIHHLYSVNKIIKNIINTYNEYQDKSFSEYTSDDLSFILQKFLDIQSQYPLGECVDKRLHVLFHSLYGQYDNTPEQWYKFKEDYKKGVYKNIA